MQYGHLQHLTTQHRQRKPKNLISLRVLFANCLASLFRQQLVGICQPISERKPSSVSKIASDGSVWLGQTIRTLLRKIRRCGQDFAFFSAGNPIDGKSAKAEL